MSNAKIIYMDEIKNLTDISSLKNVEDLTVWDCPNVGDVSILSGLKRFTSPFGCDINFALVKNLEYIFIDNRGSNIKNINNLSKAKEIDPLLSP